MRIAIPTLSVALLLLAAPALAVPTNYAADDGSGDITLGQGAGGDFLYGNYFSVVGGADLLVEVQVAFGDVNVQVGRSFTVVIYDDLDDDGNPTAGLTQLLSVAGTVQNPQATGGSHTFEVVGIPATNASGGFFIAVYMSGIGDPYPALHDTGSVSGQSWFAEHGSSGGLDLSNPFGSATLSGQPGTFGFAGNFLVRVKAVPEPGTGVLVASGLALLSWRRRRIRA